ncbi:MAG: dual-specificity RNA methyltransferase RlmN [Planctomycetota bacterium]|jgi:23S rRNA (adenine2503-C2)-methyltransferase
MPDRATTPRHLFDFDQAALREHCVSLDLPAFVADQVLDWVYRKHVTDPGAMSNLSPRTQEALFDSVVIEQSATLGHQLATDGTQKLLLQWRDESAERRLPVFQPDPARQTECVMIPVERRRTACISSQIGCPVGCRFCASGLGGLDGNLRTGQIVEQVHRLGVLDGVGRITNVVFMGMGEPLANFAAVTGAIRTLNADWGFGISAGKITVSTVGLPAAILRLVEFDIPVTLALSLHAPNDELRRTLIPWAEYAPIDELLDACQEYFAKTGREITLEYLLLRGVNDRPRHADELAAVARRLRANVNLIRYNEVRGLPYDRPTTADVRAFQQRLRAGRINAHIRASRGRDIAAACGQLRHEAADSVPARAPARRT